MTQAPLPPQTTQGFTFPVVTQFSVFLSNKVGKMLDLIEHFEGTACQVCAISVHEASDHAVVRIVTNNAGSARETLKKDAFPFSERDVLVVELDAKHTLAGICLALLGAELSIHFAYPLLSRPPLGPAIAIAVDDLTLAGQLLRRKEFRLLAEGDFLAPA